MSDIKLTELTGSSRRLSVQDGGPDTLAQVLRGLPTFHDDRLLVGYDTSDDAAVYQLTPELALIQTVDIFPPAVDDACRVRPDCRCQLTVRRMGHGREARLCMKHSHVP